MNEKRLAILIKLGVIALSAGAFYVSQIIAKYPHRSIELGAAAATMTLLANRIPAAFRRKKKSGAIPLPPVMGVFAVLMLLALSGCAGMRPRVSPSGSDERCQSLELRHMIASGIAAGAAAFATGGVFPAYLEDDPNMRFRWGVAEAAAISIGSAAMVIGSYVDDLHESECGTRTSTTVR